MATLHIHKYATEIIIYNYCQDIIYQLKFSKVMTENGFKIFLYVNKIYIFFFIKLD